MVEPPRGCQLLCGRYPTNCPRWGGWDEARGLRTWWVLSLAPAVRVQHPPCVRWVPWCKEKLRREHNMKRIGPRMVSGMGDPAQDGGAVVPRMAGDHFTEAGGTLA